MIMNMNNKEKQTIYMAIINDYKSHWNDQCYSQIHINRGEWFSPNYQSILKQFSWNFTHTIVHLCRDNPESFAKF